MRRVHLFGSKIGTSNEIPALQASMRYNSVGPNYNIFF